MFETLYCRLFICYPVLLSIAVILVSWAAVPTFAQCPSNATSVNYYNGNCYDKLFLTGKAVRQFLI